jgi:Fe-S oxidoreductase/coenzyme F420-reducing hydrogenase delta subunit
MSETFRPRIVLFACNWCSYPGADAAGIARIAQSPDFRIFRTMCSGRVDPAFVLHAFEQGADGVLVTGCHPGEILGIGKERIGLEWISAGEASRFASVVNGFVERVRKLGPLPLYAPAGKPESPQEGSLQRAVLATGAFTCLDCGKCTGICPIAYRRDGYSPRRTVAQALDGARERPALAQSIWACRTCSLCESVCPAGVHYNELIRSLRTDTQNSGNEPRLCRGGALATTARIQAASSASQSRLDWVTEDLHIAETGDVLLFVGCLPYFDAVYSDLELETVEIARNAIRILNQLDIEPVLLRDEKCCGHDLLWNGDRRSFDRQVQANVEQIKESGAKTLVFVCPECTYTFREEYPGRALAGVSFQHLAEFIAPRMDELPLVGTAAHLTFQDPCRLGRMMGVFEEPRTVLRSVPGVELREMERSGKRSLCCSGTGFVGCDGVIKQLQRERLAEARSTGSRTLVTACPKCQIHFRCAQKDPFWAEEDRVEIRDLTTVVASALSSVPEPVSVATSHASRKTLHARED